MTTFHPSDLSRHQSAPIHRSTRRSAPGAGALRTAGAAVLAAGLLLVPLTASAHVRVQGDSTAAGSFSALTFRVPNESDTASTVKVQVQLPQDTPFLYVSSKPVPGWSAAIAEAPLPTPVTVSGTEITKAARTVTWTADGDANGVQPGQYQEFSISVGPLPAAAEILLPTTQTYSDGEVANWSEPTPASGEEPENPAPVLVVTAAAAEPGPTAGAAPAEPTATVAGAAADPVARALGGVGLAAGLAALVVAVMTTRRRRSA